MKLQLKNVKIFESLSEETLCYSATVYVDGTRTVEVSNHGNGGPDMQHKARGSRLSVVEVNDWCKANLPRLDSDYFDGGLEQDLEVWCHTEAERIGIKNAEANARLIAEASAMLEALRQTTDELDECAQFFSERKMRRSEARLDTIIDNARAILARIDG